LIECKQVRLQRLTDNIEDLYIDWEPFKISCNCSDLPVSIGSRGIVEALVFILLMIHVMIVLLACRFLSINPSIGSPMTALQTSK
jgi:hypothetical protein